MRLSRYSVRHPILTIMSVLIVMILGGISLFRLPIDLMPDITYPTLSVFSRYENASPEEMEELITRPIEEAMSAVPGVEEVTSFSSEGVSNVRISFTWGTDLDAAAADIRDRLDRVVRNLPEEAERPYLRKFDLASFPILILGAASDLDPIQMRRIIDDQVKYRIERLPGVATVDVHGGLDREIHVNLLASKVKALGLPLDQILSKIRAENVTVPAGTLERGNLDVMVRTPGEYTSLDELRDTVIAIREGVPIQVRDIATVEDAWEKVTRIARINGKPGVRMAVLKQSGMNTVDVAQGVLKEIEKINQDIPQIHVTPIIDTSDYIQRSISNVGTSILYGGVLAIFVLLLFLRNIRSTTVIGTAIPISIIATFTLMYFGGFTLNMMTLGGLALGVGMLVDNAIVVLENIYRLRESGIPRDQAAIDGSEEVTAAIVASTLTTLVVFLPMIFVRGMAGVMFKQLAYVVSFALACSLASALTLVPMLSSLILKRPKNNPSGKNTLGRKIFMASGRFFSKLEESYKGALHYALGHRKLVLGCALLVLFGSLMLIPLVGSEFMPETDEGEVRVSLEMEVGTRLGVLGRAFDAVEEVVRREVPEIKNTATFIGGSTWRGTGGHTGEMRISLKPEAERSRSSEEIAAVLRGKLSGIPGATVRTRAGQGLFILRMGSSGEEKLELEVRGHDLEASDFLAREVKELVEGVAGVTDVRVSRESGSPEELIIVDRQKAADMKLTVSQIGDALQTIISGTEASKYREGGKEYAILVKLKDAERMDTREVLDLTLTNGDGNPVVLRNVLKVRPRTGPVFVERKDQERIVTVSANIAGRDLGSIVNDIKRGLQTIPVPRNFTVSFGADYEEQQKANRELLLSVVLALVMVYMVMASLYESLLDPLVVMFSVPLAAIGVILMLFLTRTTFNVQSFIGCIMLGGIVVNNAILLVDHTNLLRRRGMSLFEAIEEAGRRRLRPILMTAATTMLALVPLAIGLGEGGEAQAPLARAVLGGLFSSTLITLVVIPVVYSMFKTRMKRKGEEEK
jgi:HAE1 family hydrophobic/amphiphilic exporter-1